jgi:hypothetical protein
MKYMGSCPLNWKHFSVSVSVGKKLVVTISGYFLIKTCVKFTFSFNFVKDGVKRTLDYWFINEILI